MILAVCSPMAAAHQLKGTNGLEFPVAIRPMARDESLPFIRQANPWRSGIDNVRVVVRQPCGVDSLGTLDLPR